MQPVNPTRTLVNAGNAKCTWDNAGKAERTWENDAEACICCCCYVQGSSSLPRSSSSPFASSSQQDSGGFERGSGVRPRNFSSRSSSCMRRQSWSKRAPEQQDLLGMSRSFSHMPGMVQGIDLRRRQDQANACECPRCMPPPSFSSTHPAWWLCTGEWRQPSKLLDPCFAVCSA
jgi:hypothetical protein